MIARWTRAYGASPLHLLALLACFSLAGYAALQARTGPLPLRMAVWFVGAAIAHDLVLFPLYAIADRSLRALTSRRPRQSRTTGGAVNYLRVPLLLSVLLLVMFYPLVLHRSEGPYGNASGLDQSAYLSHWLLVSGIAFAVSALLFVLRRGRRREAEPAEEQPVGIRGGSR